MKIRLCLVGKLRKGPELEIFNRYLLRLENIGNSINLFPIEVDQFDDFQWKRKFLDKKFLDRHLKENYRFLLDEKGQNITSKRFAKKICHIRDEGYREALFFIGGARGFPARSGETFNEKICFGSMVWPHMLVRLMLMEQLYRASTIIAGLPYHKE